MAPLGAMSGKSAKAPRIAIVVAFPTRINPHLKFLSSGLVWR
jgi:hypothetical protein